MHKSHSIHLIRIEMTIDISNRCLKKLKEADVSISQKLDRNYLEQLVRTDIMNDAIEYIDISKHEIDESFVSDVVNIIIMSTNMEHLREIVNFNITEYGVVSVAIGNTIGNAVNNDHDWTLLKDADTTELCTGHLKNIKAILHELLDSMANYTNFNVIKTVLNDNDAIKKLLNIVFIYNLLIDMWNNMLTSIEVALNCTKVMITDTPFTIDRQTIEKTRKQYLPTVKENSDDTI